MEKHIEANNPDLIFTGIQMPEMDGFAMIAELKKDKRFANIPIIVNSHLNREGDQAKAIALGVQEFLYYGFVTMNEVVKKARALIAKDSLQNNRA